MKQRYPIICLGFLLLIALVASMMARPAWAQTGYRLPWANGTATLHHLLESVKQSVRERQSYTGGAK